MVGINAFPTILFYPANGSTDLVRLFLGFICEETNFVNMFYIKLQKIKELEFWRRYSTV